jgi:hypothetical protein
VPLAYCIDASGASVPTDQRGITRPQGAACDIGSVEVVQRLYNVCLLYDSTKPVNSGATLPIKLYLCDGTICLLQASLSKPLALPKRPTRPLERFKDSGNAQSRL